MAEAANKVIEVIFKARTNKALIVVCTRGGGGGTTPETTEIWTHL